MRVIIIFIGFWISTGFWISLYSVESGIYAANIICGLCLIKVGVSALKKTKKTVRSNYKMLMCSLLAGFVECLFLWFWTKGFIDKHLYELAYMFYSFLFLYVFVLVALLELMSRGISILPEKYREIPILPEKYKRNIVIFLDFNIAVLFLLTIPIVVWFLYGYLMVALSS